MGRMYDVSKYVEGAVIEFTDDVWFFHAQFHAKGERAVIVKVEKNDTVDRFRVQIEFMDPQKPEKRAPGSLMGGIFNVDYLMDISKVVDAGKDSIEYKKGQILRIRHGRHKGCEMEVVDVHDDVVECDIVKISKFTRRTCDTLYPIRRIYSVDELEDYAKLVEETKNERPQRPGCLADITTD